MTESSSETTASVPSVQVDRPAGHTPGPWLREGDFHELCRVEFSGGGHYVTISGPDRTLPIAFVIGDPDTYWRDDIETEANARLIAAAPDLLEALRPLAQCFIPETDTALPDSDTGRYPFTMGEIRAALAAISRATGGSQ